MNTTYLFKLFLKQYMFNGSSGLKPCGQAKYLWAMMRCLLPLLLIVAQSVGAQERDTVRFYHPNGEVSSEGIMVGGKPDGYWRTFYTSGVLKSEGNRRDNMLDSIWQFYSERGLLTQLITYAKDKRNGMRKSFDEEGRLSQVEFFKEDVRSERIEWYYPSAQIRELVPMDTLGKGLEHGVGYIYDEDDGRIIEVNTYVNGYLSGRERVNRKDKFGQRQGMWRTFHGNMAAHEEGRYRNDKKDGYWREYDESGNLVETVKYDNGILIPEPTELAKIDIKRTFHPNAQVKTVGSYLKGLEEGVHRFFTKEGNVESSKIYRGGKVIGEGIIDPEGRRQGKWKEFYDTGELRSEGIYKENRREGEWVFYYRDGKEEQRGAYRKGLPDGDWRWLHNNGKLWREEVFYEGREDGISVEYNDTGAVVSKGQYIDGERDGQWIIDIGEHREEGEYRVGQRYGVWKYYFRNGKLKFEGKFMDGREEAEHISYYDNGNIRDRGRYKFGEREGDWTYFTVEGDIITVVNYERGEVARVDGIRIPKKQDDNKENQ